MRIVPVAIVLAIFLSTAAGCGGSSRRDGRRSVVAAFYPLAFAAELVGGSVVRVTNLTPAGAEPHDIELTPRDIADIQKAAVVLYLSHGFQPAVEDAVRGAHGTRIDLLSNGRLRRGLGSEAGRTDPHVWLDPAVFARAVRRIGAALGRRRQAAGLIARLEALDRAYRRGLRHCARRDFVTSHAAFGYLAARYGLRQIAITGMDPAGEPSPARLAELVRLVRREHVRTVFFERLVSPKLAQTVAREAGAHAAVLDPIEGLTSGEQRRGDTYLTLMRANLAQLRRALACR